MRTFTSRRLSSPIGPIVAAIAALASMALLRFWQPLGNSGLSICLFRRCVGLGCPGCGMTRAISRFVKGQWSDSMSMHPLAPLVLIQVIAASLLWLASSMGRITLKPGKWIDWILIGNLVALLAVWMVRLITGTLPPA